MYTSFGLSCRIRCIKMGSDALLLVRSYDYKKANIQNFQLRSAAIRPKFMNKP